MTKIRQSAKGETCTIRFPGCMNDKTTTVLCHSPFIEDGKGFGTKPPDHLAAYGCFHCHEILDGRRQVDGLNMDQKRDYFHIAMKRTQDKLIEKGLIVIK